MARKGAVASSPSIRTSGASASPTSFTVAFWFRHEDVPAGGQALSDDAWGLWRLDNSVDAGFHWHHTGTNEKGFYLRQSNGTYKQCKTTSALSANTWYHFGCRYDGSAQEMTLWLNGVLDTTTGSVTNPSTATTIFEMFSTAEGTIAKSDGEMAEVGYWKVALTDAQMALLGATKVVPNLIGPNPFLYCPLFDAIYDLRGNALTTNDTTATAHPPGVVTYSGYLESPPISQPQFRTPPQTPTVFGNSAEPIEDVDVGQLLAIQPISQPIAARRGVRPELFTLWPVPIEDVDPGQLLSFEPIAQPLFTKAPQTPAVFGNGAEPIENETRISLNALGASVAKRYKFGSY